MVTGPGMLLDNKSAGVLCKAHQVFFLLLILILIKAHHVFFLLLILIKAHQVFFLLLILILIKAHQVFFLLPLFILIKAHQVFFLLLLHILIVLIAVVRPSPDTLTLRNQSRLGPLVRLELEKARLDITEREDAEACLQTQQEELRAQKLEMEAAKQAKLKAQAGKAAMHAALVAAQAEVESLKAHKSSLEEEKLELLRKRERDVQELEVGLKKLEDEVKEREQKEQKAKAKKEATAKAKLQAAEDTMGNLAEFRLMLSGRFDGGPKELLLREVGKLLKKKGWQILVVEAGLGGDFGVKTMRNMRKMTVMAAFCFEDYGESGKSVYSSYHEVKYAYEHHIPILPLKLYPGEWAPAVQGDEDGAAQNEFVLGPSKVYKEFKEPFDYEVIANAIMQELQKGKPSTHFQDAPSGVLSTDSELMTKNKVSQESVVDVSKEFMNLHELKAIKVEIKNVQPQTDGTSMSGCASCPVSRCVIS